MKIWISLVIMGVMLAGCVSGTGNQAQNRQTLVSTFTLFPTPTIESTTATATQPPTVTTTATSAPTTTNIPPTLTPGATVATTAPPTPSQAATPAAVIPNTQGSGVPAFDHIVVIMFENRDYNEVIGKSQLTNFNRLARENVLLTQYYGVAHPSLPNYLALFGGSTFGVTNDCGACFLNHASLPDLLEANGRSWKTYQEDMPSPCYVGFTSQYDLNHNPFLYFDPIRKDKPRCEQSVVPLTQLDTDLSAGQLPNFSFIMPNLCHSAHSCNLSEADQWLGPMIAKLQASPALGQNSLIVVTFDEASSDNSSCCGLPRSAGGRIVTMVISPLAQSGIQDDTPLSHYSLLKTIRLAWNLPALGFDDNPATQAITGIWK